MTIITKGIIIGMIVSFPVGPLGIISMHRAINSGWKRGFFSGLGAATSDIVYSTGAVFGVSYFYDLINKHQYLIDKFVGVLFLIVGTGIFFNAMKNKLINGSRKKGDIHPAFSNFLLGLANPVTLLIFLTIFAKMGMILQQDEIMQNCILIVSIYAGSAFFWFLTSNLVSNLRSNLNLEMVYQFNKIVGILIALFGVLSILKGIPSIWIVN